MTGRPPSSPSSSPRLPSPPPMAEDQTKPVSPSPGASQHAGSRITMMSDVSASRRIRPGTKSADIAEGPPLIDVSEIDSAFQLAEHLKALHWSFIRSSNSRNTLPLSAEQAASLATPPTGIDKSIWLYELCRFLVQKLNAVIISLHQDHPPCSAETCPEMRASEWQYLCAVHNPPKPCCAIDYCTHTLDWAGDSLTNPNHFPSRLSLNSDVSSTGNSQVKTITNIMRRVYRIFAHSWFSHRAMFWQVENKTGLYIFFKTVCDAYALIPEDNYTIPPEAEGHEQQPLQSSKAVPQPGQPTSILRRPETNSDAEDHSSSNALAAPGATARRHRHTPSKGVPVDTVPEENEEDDASSITSSTDTTARIESPPPFPSPARRDTQLRIYPSSPASSSPQPGGSRTSGPNVSIIPSPSTPSSLPPPNKNPSTPPNHTTGSSNSSVAPAELATAPWPVIDDLEPAPAGTASSPPSYTTYTTSTSTPESTSKTSSSGPVSPPFISTSNPQKPFSPFSSFSPASPKAATFEEVQEMKEEQDKLGEEAAEKSETTEKEGEQAGDTEAADASDATKSVED